MQISTSFVQSQKHLTKSDKFVHIQPSQIAEVLEGHGFDLVHLKSGRAKDMARVDHQTTIARYRSRDTFEIDGLMLDIMFKVPHLYGALEARLGFFRDVCANQWNMGKYFNIAKVRHTGDCLTQLDTLIPTLVAQRTQLVETIREMQMRDVTPKQIADLAEFTAHSRLSGVEGLVLPSVKAVDLVRVRRNEDQKPTLFNVINLLQENAMRFGLRYQTKSVDDAGRDVVRNMVSRKVNEQTERAIDLNAAIWDQAIELLNAA